MPRTSMDEVTAVPGTEFLYDQSGRGLDSQGEFSDYQHLAKGDSHILLVPQPSLTDENDPLRWSTAKKWTAFGVSLAYAFWGPSPGQLWQLGSEFFNISLQRMTYANGATLICQGVATTIWMPFAVKYGRRPVYLLSSLLMIVACIWLGIASKTRFTPFLVGRAFLGIWEAPIESIVPSTITDIFFLHDRGTMVSIYGLSVLGGNELGPTLSAFIIQYLGMNWAFYIVGMFLGLNLLIMIVAMPETKYRGNRATIVPRSVLRKQERTDSKAGVIHHESTVSVTDSTQHTQARSWWKEVVQPPTSDPEVKFFHAFARPFVLMVYPTVVWSCIIYGMALSWNVILGSVTAQLFAPPPYNFSPSAQGLVFLSPLVGSIVGTYLCGPVADRVANCLTRRANGIREPEMRLPVCAIAMALTLVGGVATGLMFHYQVSWVGPVIGFGIISTGAQMGATLSMSYALDCHKELSVELMVTIASLKSLIAWIWTWCINDWLVMSGPLVVFSSIAAINAVVYLSTLLFYYKGKNIRIFLAKRRPGRPVGL